MVEDVTEAALAYASLGLYVHPVYPVDEQGTCTCPAGAACRTPGKHPTLSGWPERTSRDPAQIRAWFSNGRPTNLGVATGPRSGVFVVDVDGAAALEWIRSKPMPLTWILRTGSGGTHYWFRYPASVTVSNNTRALYKDEATGSGIDVRGEGGQVVVPPSRNASGAYTWFAGCAPGECELAEAPAWLLEALAADSGGQKPAAPLEEQIPAGERNSTLASLAGSMRRRGASAEAILAALLVENRDRCQPPLERGEVEAIATSVSRYAPEAPLVVTYSTPQPTAATAGGVLHVSEREWNLRGSDFARMEVVQAAPLLGGAGTGTLLAAGDLAVWHGAPRSWKSFTALLSAVCVATGTPLAGNWPATRSRVMYAQEEGSLAAWQRRLLWCLCASHTEPEDLEDFLWTSASVGLRLDNLVWIDALRRELEKVQPAVLFLDPLSRLSGHDENDATETNAFVDLVKSLQAAAASELSVVLIHHDRKRQIGATGRRAESMRGSSALWGACGTVSFDRTEDGCAVSAELKDAEPVPKFELSYAIDGDQMTVTYADAPPSSRTEVAEEAIMAAVLAAARPVTHSELLEATKLADTRARDARNRLIQAGRLEQAGQRGRALTYRVPPELVRKC